MRSLTMALPLLAFLAALSQGLFPVGGSMDMGADPASTAIVAQKRARALARRLQRAQQEQAGATRPPQIARRH